MKVKGTRSWCLIEGYVKENNYARFHFLSYQRFRETLFLFLTQHKILTKCFIKYRSRAKSWCSACLKRMSRKNAMQGFILTAITGAEKHTSVFYSKLNLAISMGNEI